jgi:hypothetical protein
MEQTQMANPTERTENGWIRIRSVAAGFLCVMGLPIALALADVSTPATQAAAAVVDSEPVQHFHAAQAQFDVGPGSDEALVAALPESR